jgi:formylglycine-generating enzyme required for sulfatase activity
MDELSGISNLVVEEDYIEFTYSAMPDIQAGYLVYSFTYEGRGFLFRVSQVVLPGSNQMRLIVVPATFDDLYSEGAFGFNETPQTMQALNGLYDLSGVSLIDVTGTNGGGTVFSLKVTIPSGYMDVDLNPAYNRAFGLLPSSRYLDFQLNGEYILDLDLHIEFSGQGSFDKEFAHIPIFGIPTTPPLTFWLVSGIKGDMAATADIETGLHVISDVDCGIRYENFEPVFPGTYHVSNGSVFQMTPKSPVYTADGSFGAHLYFKLVASVGMLYYADANLYVGAGAGPCVNYSPPSCTELNLKSDVFLGAKAAFFGWGVTANFYSHEWDLGHWGNCDVPVINSFYGDPMHIQSGDNTTLNWDVTGATNIEIPALGISGLSETGSTSQAPVSDTVYQLVASNPTGISTLLAPVFVADQDPCPKLTGLYPTGGPFAEGATVAMHVTYTGTPEQINIDYGGSQSTISPPVTTFNVTATGTPEYLTATTETSGCSDSEQSVYIPSDVNQPPPPPGVEEVDAIVGNLFVIAGGTFTQGSPPSEFCADSDEEQFTHTLTRDLLVMETEVSRQMWADLKAVQSSLLSDPTNTSYGNGMNNPVQNISWYEAVLFANLLSLERGLTQCYYKDESFTTPLDAGNYTSGSFYCNFDATGYRLPSEGEWEFFTRGGTTGAFSIDEPNYTTGNCSSIITTPGTWPNLESVAWFIANKYDSTGNSTSKPVGSKEANPWGLKDVHGNVWEWCWDWYSSDYPSGSASNYTGSTSGSDRVVRGGYWSGKARVCRSAHRNMYIPSYRSSTLGFRLVRTYP